jgi:hypothetical protein
MKAAPVLSDCGEQELVALTDAELVRRAYALVDELEDDSAGPLFQTLNEAFERFAPDAAWQELQRLYTDEADPVRELESSRERAAERAYSRWLVRSTDAERLG